MRVLFGVIVNSWPFKLLLSLFIMCVVSNMSFSHDYMVLFLSPLLDLSLWLRTPSGCKFLGLSCRFIIHNAQQQQKRANLIIPTAMQQIVFPCELQNLPYRHIRVFNIDVSKFVSFDNLSLKFLILITFSLTC